MALRRGGADTIPRSSSCRVRAARGLQIGIPSDHLVARRGNQPANLPRAELWPLSPPHHGRFASGRASPGPDRSQLTALRESRSSSPFSFMRGPARAGARSESGTPSVVLHLLGVPAASDAELSGRPRGASSRDLLAVTMVSRSMRGISGPTLSGGCPPAGHDRPMGRRWSSTPRVARRRRKGLRRLVGIAFLGDEHRLYRYPPGARDSSMRLRFGGEDQRPMSMMRSSVDAGVSASITGWARTRSAARAC